MNLNDTNIAAAFQPLVDEIKSAFARRITNQATDYFDNFGNTRPRFGEMGKHKAGYSVHLHDCWGAFQQFLKNADDKGWGAYNAPQKLDEAYLNKVAAEMAEDSVKGMIAKTLKKVGDLQDVDLFFRGNGDFVINGALEGKRVRCDQQTVWKENKLRRPYNQFPMRLYVDGQFTPAVKFKAAISA